MSIEHFLITKTGVLESVVLGTTLLMLLDAGLTRARRWIRRWMERRERKDET